MNIALISMDEGGYQPLGIAGPIAYLRKAGFNVKALDFSKSEPSIGNKIDLVAFSVPIFGSVDLSLCKAKELRQQGYAGPLVFYNQYATAQPESFLLDEQCYVILGEYEEELTTIANSLKHKKRITNVENTWWQGRPKPGKALKRSHFLVPDRSDLPSLTEYARWDGSVVGNVETMRGCAHPCSYCSVFAAYERRVIKIPEEIILQDISNLVAMSATHITFIDADFFSTGKRGCGIVKKMHQQFPDLRFDITARLDDIIRYRPLVEEMKRQGCVEITSAFEFPDENVLNILNKGIFLDQMKKAVNILKDIGIRLKPTFITYTPWIDCQQMEKLDQFTNELGISDLIDPLQKQTRLLLYKGSPLLETVHAHSLRLVDRGSFYDWVHPDPKVDEAYNNLEFENSDARKRCCIKG